MKKTVSVIIIIITFIILYLLQSGIFTSITIGGIKPNIIIIGILFIGLYAGRKIGVIVGFIVGLIIDNCITRNLGTTAVMLGLIGFLGGYFDKNFSKEIKFTIILMIIGSTIVYESGLYILNLIMGNMELEIMNFMKILLVEMLYNVILTIIFYPLLKKIGDILETIFKEQKVLTRYF